jgi:hypothetical protein
MTASSELTAAGRNYFGPMGIYQIGRSRIWIDDHGWWLGLVEFQPSSHSKGAYLNVSVMWLWSETDHFVFDVHARVHQHVEYLNDEQFAPEADNLARLAKVQLTKYREEFPDVAHAAAYLVANNSVSDLLNAGMAYGLIGRREDGLPFLNRYIAYDDDREWAVRQRNEVQALVDLRDGDSLKTAIEQRIDSSRESLGLPPR